MKYCAAVAFAERTALREEIFRPARLIGGAALEQRIRSRTRNQFRRFWINAWDYDPTPSLADDMGEEGVRYVQFTWDATRRLAAGLGPVSAKDPGADPVEFAIDLAADCIALRRAMEDPASAALAPKLLWEVAKRGRVDARAALLVDIAKAENEAAAGSPGVPAMAPLDLYSAVVAEARGAIDPDEARRIAITYIQPAADSEDEDDLSSHAKGPAVELRRADLLVRAGRIADAYLLLATRTDKPAMARFLVLDHALRATWLDYEDLLDSMTDPGLEALVERLRASAQAVGQQISQSHLRDLSEELTLTGLPRPYGAALMAGRRRIADEPQAGLALWNTVVALRATGLQAPTQAGANGRILVVAGKGDQAGPDWVAHCRQLAARGVRIAILSAPDASPDWSPVALSDIEHIADATALDAWFAAAEAPTLVTRGPQYVAPDLVWAWSELTPAGEIRSVSVDVLPATVDTPLILELAYHSRSTDTLLLGAGVAMDHARLTGAAEAVFADMAASHGATALATIGIAPKAPAAEAVKTIVIYDAATAPRIDDDLPVHMIGLYDPDSPHGGRTLSLKEALAGLPADVDDETPVLFQAQDMRYPRAYVRSALTAFQDHAGRLELSFLPLRRTTNLEACQPVIVNSAAITPLACLATTCLTLGAVRRIAESDVARLSTVVENDTPGFLLLPLFDLPFLGAHERHIRNFLGAEAERGVVAVEGGASLAEESLHGLTEPSKRILAPVIRRRAFMRRLADNLELDDFSDLEGRDIGSRLTLCREVAQAGYLTAASHLLDEILSTPSEELAASPRFKELLRLVMDLGCQKAFADRHQYAIGYLIQERPTDVGMTFDVLASAMEPVDLERVVLVAAGSLKPEKRDRAVLRVLDAANKYATPPAMSWILLKVFGRISKDVLSRPSVMNMMRGMLLRSDIDGARLSALGATPRLIDNLTAVPLPEQAAAAAACGDAETIANVVNSWIADDLPLSDLSKIFRTFSDELSQGGLADRVSAYRLYDTPIARLTFAGIIGDQDYLERHLGLDPTADAEIIGRARTGRLDWLQDRLDALGAPLQIDTPAFTTGSLTGFFDSVLASASGKTVRRREPLVTTVMTVFEPDLALLARAMDSILTQEGVAVELIVIDDGSGEEASAGIRDLVASRRGVVFERFAVNQGPYVGRNRALELARGEYFAIQDGDDLAHPARFRTQIAALEAGGEKAVLSTSHHLRIDAGGKPQFEFDLGLLGDGTMTSMFRRAVFDRLGGFAHVRSRGDVEMRERLRAALGDRAIVHVPYPLVYCNAAPNTLSNRTARTTPQYLKLFRANFASQHRQLRQAVAVGEPIAPPNSAVPPALRP